MKDSTILIIAVILLIIIILSFAGSRYYNSSCKKNTNNEIVFGNNKYIGENLDHENNDNKMGKDMIINSETEKAKFSLPRPFIPIY